MELSEEEKEEKIDKLANIILELNLTLRQCDCYAIAKKLIDLDLIKD